MVLCRKEIPYTFVQKLFYAVLCGNIIGNNGSEYLQVPDSIYSI